MQSINETSEKPFDESPSPFESLGFSSDSSPSMRASKASASSRRETCGESVVPPPSPLFKELSISTKDMISVLKSGKPRKDFRVVEGQIPAILKAALLLDFSSEEVFEIAHRCDLYAAEREHRQPKVLFILGPPACGKTTMLNKTASSLFGRSENAVTIDGDIFRTVHTGFQMVALHGSRNRLIHKDAWEIMKKTKHMDKIKEEIVSYAVQNRQHIKVPDVATNKNRIEAFLSQLEQAGYEMHAICLWAPKAVTEARGRPRSVKDGKVFTTNSYASSNENTLFFGRLWEAEIAKGNSQYKNVAYYDNTCHPAKLVDSVEFERLINLTDEQAKEHIRHREVIERLEDGRRASKGELVRPTIHKHWLDQRRGQAGFLAGVAVTLGCLVFFRCVPLKHMGSRY